LTTIRVSLPQVVSIGLYAIAITDIVNVGCFDGALWGFAALQLGLSLVLLLCGIILARKMNSMIRNAELRLSKQKQLFAIVIVRFPSRPLSLPLSYLHP